MSRRGQLVLLTAAIVAAALAPALLAYLQLGYHADTDAAADFEDPATNAVRVLERTTFEASAAVAGEYTWSNRTRAAERVREVVRPRIDRLAGSRVTDGTATLVTYNASAALTWAGESCPGGEGRAFGPCRTDDGVVVQERAGETVLVAVAFDVRVVRERGETSLTVVTEPV